MIVPDFKTEEQKTPREDILGTQNFTIEKLASLVQNLEKQLQTALRTYTVALNDLGKASWKMTRPITVTVEQHAPDDFVACFYDADVYGYGDSIPSSLDDLKKHLVSQYEFLVAESQRSELGPVPAEQLLVLGRVIEKGNGHEFVLCEVGLLRRDRSNCENRSVQVRLRLSYHSAGCFR